MTGHQFLNHRYLHPKSNPNTVDDTLDIFLMMHRELRERDQVATLNLLAAEFKRLDPGPMAVTMADLPLLISRHLLKFGVVRRCVTSMAQNTHHAMTVNAGYVAFVNGCFNAGKYHACDIVNINETNIDFDLASGATSAGRGKRIIGCATNGSF
jgi:hypothetical protein